MQIKTKIVRSHTADSKPIKQEVNSTAILPPLLFPAIALPAYLFVLREVDEHRDEIGLEVVELNDLGELADPSGGGAANHRSVVLTEIPELGSKLGWKVVGRVNTCDCVEHNATVANNIAIVVENEQAQPGRL